MILEHDYYAKFRYDRHPVGALHGLDRARVIYCGSASKTLSPALRLGWAVVSPALRAHVTEQRAHADLGTATLDQLAPARFIERGNYDRHLRRSRSEYRRRRHDALISALDDLLRAGAIRGAAAGLHLVVPIATGEHDARAAAHSADVALATMCKHVMRGTQDPALVLGYGRMGPPALRTAVTALAEALARAG